MLESSARVGQESNPREAEMPDMANMWSLLVWEGGFHDEYHSSGVSQNRVSDFSLICGSWFSSESVYHEFLERVA